MPNLEVIVKLTERCNIDCTYCYVFNAEDRGFEKHSALMSADTAAAMTRYLVNAAKLLGSVRITVYFQGGEPLLQKRDRFDVTLRNLRSAFGGGSTELRLAVQTNAMLIDDGWLDLFARHGVHVAISLDGPEHVNDVARVDHRGRGTYKRTVQGLNKLLQAYRSGQLRTSPSVLTVIQPQHDAAAVFQHFVDLGVRNLHYQLPDASHNTLNRLSAVALTRYLHDLFTAWASVPRGTVRIRIFADAIARLTHRGGRLKPAVAVSVSSDGDIGPPDDWRNYTQLLFELGLTVSNSSVLDFLNHPATVAANREIESLPAGCRDCVWRDACDGGNFVNALHRHDIRTGFARPSVYCEVLQSVFVDCLDLLLVNGATPERLVTSVAEALSEAS